jgi:hypothetical protein
MDYPKFLVNISYVSPYPSGQRLINVNGVTSSINTYSGGYYIANMPNLSISATGSTYETSLSNLLLAATSSNTGSPGYYF